MSRTTSAHFGPRLVARPTGRLRAAALVRPARAIANVPPLQGEPSAIYERALEQHDVLVRALNYVGVETLVLDPDDFDGRAVAIADTAVVFEDGATIARLSALSRRDEASRTERAFAERDVPLAGHIVAPGLIDGGDVVLVGSTAFVADGPRGNALGRAGFGAIAAAHGYHVVSVPLPAGSAPLRALVGAIAKDTVVIAGNLDPKPFADFKTIVLERGEELAAGVLNISEHHVLAEVRYRTSLARMRKAGVTVDSIDLYEFTKIGVTPSLLALAIKRDG